MASECLLVLSNSLGFNKIIANMWTEFVDVPGSQQMTLSLQIQLKSVKSAMLMILMVAVIQMMGQTQQTLHQNNLQNNLQQTYNWRISVIS